MSVTNNNPGKKFTVTSERIHWDTDITLISDLLSPEECDHLIKIAEPKLTRSSTFSGKEDYRRTSSSVYLTDYKEDPVVKEIIYRCSILSGYPMSHVEIPQIVRYLPGQQFMGHADNFPAGNDNGIRWGQRDYTFFIYLNEPDREADPEQTGGETYFSGQDFRVKPKRGAAAFWRNVKVPTGEDEEYNKISHSGEKTDNWTKFGMNVWIRHKPWGNYTY